VVETEATIPQCLNIIWNSDFRRSREISNDNGAFGLYHKTFTGDEWVFPILKADLDQGTLSKGRPVDLFNGARNANRLQRITPAKCAGLNYAKS
jgi:hypothetical protein